jgi:flagellar assembly protein FliH
MSSKILLPEDGPTVSPLVWRRVGAAGGAPAAAYEPVPDETQRLAMLQQEWEQKTREAYAAGQRNGEAAASGRATAEMQAAIERLARSIEEMATLRPRLRAEAEADLVRLSLAIARRVLRRELAIDPEALHGLVLGALEKLQGQEISRVRVHPAHAKMVADCLRQNSASSNVEVTADPSRELGAVVFESARGNLDASIESQLQEIERGLADRLRKQS